MTWSPLWLSLQTALVATALAFYGGITLAHWIFRSHSRVSSLIDGLLTLPIILPPTVVGFLLLLLLGRNGPVGQLLSPLGITLIFSWPATVIAATVVALPLMYKTVLGAFRQIDPDLLGCARTLGASETRIFWQIMLPLAQPGVIAGTILAFARALGEFGATLMLAGSIPGRTETMPIAIFLAVESGQMDQAMMWVGMLVVLSLASITALNRGASNVRRSRAATEPTATHLFPGTWSLQTILFWKKMGQVMRGFSSRWTQGRTEPAKSNQHSGLTAAFRKDFSTFRLNVSLTAQDQPLGILGASGSGKSMTLRCLAGLETPDQGRIVLNERVLFDAEQGINVPTAQRHIGMMWQNYALFPHMTVAQNIGFGLPAPDLNQVGKFLTLMQLEGLEHHYPQQLSGGQQQRVALARALAPQPEALLLDEPISALDSGLRSQLEDLLIQTFASYQRPTLLVTHNLDEAYRTCETLLVMAEGDAITVGNKQAIYNHPETCEVAQLTGCQNFSRIQQIDAEHILAEDWGCQLRTLSPRPSCFTHAAIRAHHLQLTPTSDRENTFLCWLTRERADAQSIMLYLKLHTPALDIHDYHFQAELSPEQWQFLKEQPLPWSLEINPHRLMLMKTTEAATILP